MSSMTAEKRELQRMVSDLPDEMAPLVVDFIKHISVYDDEPLSEDERRQIAASEVDIAAGRVYTQEEVERRLADLP